MINKAFYKELEELAIAKHLDVEDVLNETREALVKAVNTIGYNGDIEVDFDIEKQKIRIFEIKHVVSEYSLENRNSEILLEDAKVIKQRVKVGSEIKHEINLSEVTRKGADKFKSVFSQRIKALENLRAYEYFKELEGETINGDVIGFNNGYINLDLGRNQRASLPQSETLPNEKVTTGTKMKVLITSVENTTKGPRINVSRANKTLIIRLFEQIVPEVSSGIIEIVSVARDPGVRSKVAVFSRDATIDAKGTCIGPGGRRIKQINDALNGEKIDIFNYSENPINYIAESLTPAKAISVLVDEENHKSTVIVPDDQFTLAIGRGGQNVRLACMATGWKIDIKDETTAYRDEIKFRPNIR